jgi:hypothetical protein
MPKPIPKPSRTEEVLAMVAARYAAGATVTLAMIAEVGGVDEATAVKVRPWARSAREPGRIRSGRSARRG